MKSYILECMQLEYFNEIEDYISIYYMFKNALKYISKNIRKPIDDPKYIQGNLNKLNKEEIISIRQRSEEDYYICNDAINLLKNENHNGAFNKFSEVLNDFNG